MASTGSRIQGLWLQRRKDGTLPFLMQGWLDGSIDKSWMDGKQHFWMEGWVDGLMEGWREGWMDGWMEGWMDGKMNGWMTGCMD
jgi:hypothetical protein